MTEAFRLGYMQFIEKSAAKKSDADYEFVLHHFGDGEITDKDRRAIARQMVGPKALLKKYNAQKSNSLSKDEFLKWYKAVGGVGSAVDIDKEYRKRRRQDIIGRVAMALLLGGTFGTFGAIMKPEITGVSRGVSGAAGGALGALLGNAMADWQSGDFNRHYRLESELGRPVDPSEYLSALYY